MVALILDDVAANKSTVVTTGNPAEGADGSTPRSSAGSKSVRHTLSAQSPSVLQRQKSQLGLLLQLSVECNPFTIQVRVAATCINMVPCCLTENHFATPTQASTALHRVNLLLHTLRLQHIHVLRQGRLVGYLTRDMFITYFSSLQVHRGKQISTQSRASTPPVPGHQSDDEMKNPVV